uniref:Phosphofructokinase domain-containing protein n=1 Tax=Mantoniella antarctica TaxID=81844 RepID=A0A7S0T0J5_9CHLO|mmetsp:Transcript_6889/g.17147  ORF Transcript_6889/g.17147 Transcript_6889/m.17147 type:complete len:586 (+) Transcript_6889:34-1791(+)
MATALALAAPIRLPVRRSAHTPAGRPVGVSRTTPLAALGSPSHSVSGVCASNGVGIPSAPSSIRGRTRARTGTGTGGGGAGVAGGDSAPARAVLARDDVSDDGVAWDESARYTWRVGGANDIPIVHLRDVYRGTEPLVARQSPFCTKSSCPIPGLPTGARTPLNLNRTFVSELDRVLLKSMTFGSPDSLSAECDFECDVNGERLCNTCEFEPEFCIRAGPRAEIYFKPSEVHAAIVNCGGLCPGINDVIRSLVNTLEVGYDVKKISGIRFGFSGFFKDGVENLPLSRKTVRNIQSQGGSIVGCGRGGGDVNQIVNAIERQGMNMIFVIGGNGSHAGANAISQECAKRGLKVSVVGIPKTIDNDILHIDKTFGFDTAVEEAQKAIKAAATEARSALNGIGVVKLMGRQSGFIAMNAALANGDTDVCLIPEVDFAMEGPNGAVAHIKNLVASQGYAVVVLAEGAGQEYVMGAGGTDAGGNPVLGDIGPWFCKRLKAEMSCDVKYIDPTYMVRGCKANAQDSIYCAILGQNAVHGAFAGFTGISVGMVNTHAVFLPIERLIEKERLVDPDGKNWHRLLTATGQPDFVS